MPKFTIANVPGANGEYLLDLDGGFTNRELHLLKRETGVRAGEFVEAFEAGDNDLIVLLAYVAAQRSGKAFPLDLLWDAPATNSITVEQTEEEKAAEKAAREADEKLPPSSGPSETSSSSSKTTSGGPDSKNDGGSQESLPSRTGSRPSEAAAA